jgi:hypothetical protein
MVCVVAGTSDASTEPTFSATALISEATGTGKWAYTGKASQLNNDGYPVPTVTVDTTIPVSSDLRPLVDTTTETGAIYLAGINGGTLYVDGTYTNVPITGGTGAGAVFLSMTVATGIVTAATLSKLGTGSGYKVGDVVGVSNTNLGGAGSGFAATITEVVSVRNDNLARKTNFERIRTIANNGIRAITFDIGSSAGLQCEDPMIEFTTDDPNVGLKFAYSNNNPIFIYVDGYKIEESPTNNTTDTLWFYKISWAGVRKLRTYRVYSLTAQIRGIAVLAQSVLFAPPLTQLKGVYYGDSYGNTIETYNILSVPKLATEIFNRAGILAVRNITIGGTGYIAGKATSDNNVSATGFNCLAALTNNNFTDYTDTYLVVFAHGSNDSDSAQLGINALACWNLARARYPSALIVIFGGWSGATGPGASQLAVNDTLQAAFNSWGDGNSYFHSVCRDAGGSWTTGTGKWGATTGTGNADFYTGAAGIHPSVPGREYLISKMVSYIEKDLFNKGM